MKYLTIFTVFVFWGLGCLTSGGELDAQMDSFADETPELVPFPDAAAALDTEMAHAAEVYTDLMWAVYWQIMGERDAEGIRKSKAAYNALIERVPIESSVLSVRGVSFIYTARAVLRFQKLQDLQGAEADVERAIEINPENVGAKWLLVRMLNERLRNVQNKERARGLQSEMLAVLKEVVVLDPDHTGAHYYLGRLAALLGETELAITSFKALTRVLPFRAEYYWELVKLHQGQGQLLEALRSCERVVTIRPEWIPARNRLGQLYLQTGDSSAALRIFLTVLESTGAAAAHGPGPSEKAPNGIVIDAHQGISHAYEAEGDFEQAEFHGRRVITLLEEQERLMRGGRASRSDRIALANRLREARYTLAQIYSRFNSHRQAVQVFTEVLAADEKYVPALMGIGISYQILGDVVRAESYLRRAIALSEPEELPDAYNALGYLYAEQGIKLEEAAALVQRALKSVPASGEYLDSLGLIYLKQGKVDAAIKNLERAVEALPDTPEVLLHLANAYFEKGLKQKALRTLEHAAQLEPANVEIRQRLETFRSSR